MQTNCVQFYKKSTPPLSNVDNDDDVFEPVPHYNPPLTKVSNDDDVFKPLPHFNEPFSKISSDDDDDDDVFVNKVNKKRQLIKEYLAISKRAHNGMISDFPFVSDNDEDISVHFAEIKNPIINYIQKGLKKYPNLLIYLTTYFIYHITDPTTGEVIGTSTQTLRCNSLNIQRSASNALGDIYNSATNQIIQNFGHGHTKTQSTDFTKYYILLLVAMCITQ
jgi:hypothetical protein